MIQFSRAKSIDRLQYNPYFGRTRWREDWRRGLLLVLLLSIAVPSAGDVAFITSVHSSLQRRNPSCFVASKSPAWVGGTDPTTKPDYENIVGPFGRWVDHVCLTVFRNQLRDQVLRGLAEDETEGMVLSSSKRKVLADPSYYGPANFTQIVSLASAMNALYSNPERIQYRAQTVLRNLFPSWLPGQFQILFSRPFPIFSAQLNARVTAVLGVWLMGECTVNDILLESTEVGRNQGVLVTRCRFLEESQCASVCVNSCKLPTQNFFLQQMGIPLLMEPNYTDGSCQFSFGRFPNVTTEELAKSTPCLARCPTAGSYRRQHQVNVASAIPLVNNETCSMMGN